MLVTPVGSNPHGDVKTTVRQLLAEAAVLGAELELCRELVVLAVPVLVGLVGLVLGAELELCRELFVPLHSVVLSSAM